jgi:uncharacterized membrane protein (DUF2068 family)
MASYSSAQAQPVVHSAIDDRSSRAGLRTVASFEAAKGVAVLALMFVLFAVHRHAELIAEHLLFHLHIDLDRHVAHDVLAAATRLSDTRLWTIAAAALSYTTVRVVEAWGLWNRRVWAEWFALLSGAMYVPLELLRLIQHPNSIHVAVLSINVLIVVYMLYVRVQSYRCEKAALKASV